VQVGAYGYTGVEGCKHEQHKGGDAHEIGGGETNRKTQKTIINNIWINKKGARVKNNRKNSVALSHHPHKP